MMEELKICCNQDEDRAQKLLRWLQIPITSRLLSSDFVHALLLTLVSNVLHFLIQVPLQHFYRTHLDRGTWSVLIMPTCRQAVCRRFLAVLIDSKAYLQDPEVLCYVFFIVGYKDQQMHEAISFHVTPGNNHAPLESCHFAQTVKNFISSFVLALEEMSCHSYGCSTYKIGHHVQDAFDGTPVSRYGWVPRHLRPSIRNLPVVSNGRLQTHHHNFDVTIQYIWRS